MKAYYQQGDVLLFKVSAEELERRQKNKTVRYTRTDVLQHGDATGHAHRISSPGFQLWEGVQFNTTSIGVKYLALKKQGTLSHEEHKPIVLPKGVYEIRIVREFDHFLKEERKVRD